MLNISFGGCCVVVDTPFWGKDHLFFKALNDDRYLLRLLVTAPSGNNRILDAKPVWMDTDRQQGKQVFKIGMRFISRLSDLTDFLANP